MVTLSKNLKSIIVCSLWIITAKLGAQFTVSVNVTPPFKPFLSEYESLDFSRVSIVMTNNNNSSKEVTLKALLKRSDDDYVIAQTNVNPQPVGVALSFAPFESKTLTETEVNAIFSSATLEYDRALITRVATTGVIPEGNYQLCVVPYDNTALLPLADPAFCCSNVLSIQYSEPPQIISINGQECGEDVPGAKELNSLIFTWSPVVVFGINQPKYRLQVYELLNESVNADNQVFTGEPIIDLSNIIIPTAYINPNTYNLLNNVRYIFRVQVYDPSGNSVFQNQGFSQTCTFRMVRPEALEDLPDGVISNYSNQINYPLHLDTLPFEQIPIVQQISPRNNRLEEVQIFTQILKAGLSFDLGKREIFTVSDFNINNPNNRYSIVADNLNASASFYGNLYNISTATTFQNENYVLPQGDPQTQFYVSGMTSPQIRRLSPRGTKKNEFRVSYIPSRPPQKLLPDDKNYLVHNQTQEAIQTLTVKQTLCVEVLNSITDPLPKRVAFKKFEFSYPLNSVTESQILTDLYSEKSWDITLPDSTLALVRLVWLMNPEDTNSMAYRTSEIKIVNEDNIGRSLCLGVSNYDGLHVGDTVCIAGGIPLKILQLNTQNPDGTHNGRGWVQIPAWNKKFLIDFNNLKVIVGGIVSGGTAEVVHSREDLVPKTLSIAQAENLMANEQTRKTLFNVSAEESADSVASTLPFAFNIPGTNSKLFIWKLVFDTANASAFTYYQLPIMGDTLEFASYGSSVKPNCNNEGLMRLSLLSDFNIPLPGSENNKIKLMPNSERGTSFIQLSCSNVFQSGQLSGELQLDPALFTPSQDGTPSGMNIPFNASLDQNGNFLGEIEVPKFKPGGIEYVEISKGRYILDYSAIENHPSLPPPIANATPSWQGFYASDLTATITQVFTPTNSENSSNTQNNSRTDTLKIDVNELSISESDGFNCTILANRIIPFERGWNFGGWRYSLDTFQIEFKRNLLYKGLATGTIQTPLDSTNKATVMRLSLNKNTINGSLKLGNQIPFEAMNAKLNVRNNAFDFTYNKNSGVVLKLTMDVDFNTSILVPSSADTLISASGQIQQLSFSNIPGKYMTLDDVVFDRLSILEYRMGTGNNRGLAQSGGSNANRNNGSNGSNGGNNNNGGNSGSNNGSSTRNNNNNSNGATSGNNTSQNSSANSPESAENERKRQLANEDPMPDFGNLPPIEFIRREIGNDTRYEFHFRGSFETQGQDFISMKGHGNWGFIVRENGDMSPYVPEINEFGIRGAIGPVKVAGLVNIYYNDATYGKGFRGQLHASFDMMNGGLYMGLDYLSGSIERKDYWYFKGDVLLPVAIPISPGLGWKGAGLEIGKNVQFNGEGLNRNVVPDLRGSILFGGSVAMTSSTAGEKEAYKIKGGVTATLNRNFGLNQLTINAEVGLMGSKFPSENPSNELVVNANGNIIIDIQNKRFSANLNAYLFVPVRENSPDFLIKGAQANNQVGNLSILFSANEWHILVGKPSRPLSVVASIWGMNLNFNTYFMLGMNLEPFVLPNQIRNAFPNLASSATPNIEDGFAHGAQLSLSTGKKEFLCFYGELDFLVGYDIAFGLAGACDGYANPGYNGWYASGQMYGAGNVDIGINVNCMIYEGPISIMSGSAAALIKGGLPNPSYLQGGITGRYSVLGGFLSGSFYFDFSVGDFCVPEVPPVETPVSDLVLIQSLSPDNNSRDIVIGSKFNGVFNFHHNESFNIEVPNQDRSITIRTFRAIHNLNLKQGNQTIPVRSNILNRDGICLIELIPNAFLNTNSTYNLLAESYFEEFKSGAFSRARKLDGSEVPMQRRSHQFQTERTARIQPYYIQNQFPEPNRTFVYTNQNQSKFIFQQQTGGLFSQQSTVMMNISSKQATEFSSPQSVIYLAKFTNVSNNSIAVAPITSVPNRNFIEFSLEGLPNSELYKMEIIRVPSDCERYLNLTSRPSSLTFFDPSNFVNQQERIFRTLREFSSNRNITVERITVTQANGNSLQRREAQASGFEYQEASQRYIANYYEDNLYTTYFGKSSFASLENKIRSIPEANKLVINVSALKPSFIYTGTEPMCESDFDNENYTVRMVPTIRNRYYTRLEEIYEQLNFLIENNILRPAHFQNLNLRHFQNGRFTISQNTTAEILYPAVLGGIVTSNPTDLRSWRSRMNSKFTSLQASENGNFKRIDEDFLTIQGILGNVLLRRYPEYLIANQLVQLDREGRSRVSNQNAPDAVNYSLLFNSNDPQYLNKLYQLISAQNVNRTLARDEEWGIAFSHQEVKYNQVFGTNLPPENFTLSHKVANPTSTNLPSNNQNRFNNPQRRRF